MLNSFACNNKNRDADEAITMLEMFILKWRWTSAALIIHKNQTK